ncbi:hypothetical protein [Microbacterium sp. GXS0129]|uniref:hypothetical protein n=1 Tax=Microbacterium sp. GXS0129 TaxID=3377836 RepID=UPI00383A7859
MSDNSADQPTNNNAPDPSGTPLPDPTIDFGDAPATAPQPPSSGQQPTYTPPPAYEQGPTYHAPAAPYGGPEQQPPAYGAAQPAAGASVPQPDSSGATAEAAPAATGEDATWSTTAPVEPAEPTPPSGAPGYTGGAVGASYGAPNQATPAYGAPNQPAPPYGAPNEPTPPSGAPNQPAPPYGAPNQPTPPYGAPNQPTPPYGAPNQPAPSYGAPAGYPGGPAGPAGPSGPVYGSSVVADKPKGKGLLIGLIVGGVAVLAIIVVIIALAIGAIRGAAHNGTPVDGSGDGDPSSAASEAVQGYFDALIASDSKKALSYLDDTAGLDKTFLTDEVLKYSNELSPITDVEVDASDVSSYGGYATVDFMVGDNAVSEDFLVSVDKKGRAKLASYNAVQSLYLSDSQFDLELNGVPVTGDTADVFFGMYQLSSVNKNFTLPGDGKFAVTPLNAELPRASDVQLTDEARAKVIKAVSDAVTACLEEKTIAAGCGLSLESASGETLAENGITRSMDEDSLSDLADPTITISYDTVGVEVTDFGSVDFAATCTKDGATAPCEVYGAPDFYRVLVDMSDEKWKLTWENF